MRTHGDISAARVKGLTSENVARIFDICESELRKVNHAVHRVFNADETGNITVQHRNSKVVIMRGKKEVASNIGSVVTCINATGTYVPPLIVFSRVI
jgi:hypothetical protein